MRFALLLAASLTATTAAGAAELTLPLTADGIERFLAERPETTLEEFLGALPPSLHESFVLMHSSRSLHQATPTAPRQILFGSDARFLVAASGVPSDPRYQLIEFAEYVPEDGIYRFGSIDFTAPGRPVVVKNNPRCAGCHGSPARPIWGAYPRWEGAYGDQHGAVQADVRNAWAEFVRTGSETPRYRHLVFAKDPSGATFKLSARYYPYPNTDFNHELGNTVALGAVTRARKHPDFARLRHAALATNPTLLCIASESWTTITRKVNAEYAAIAANYPPTTRVDVKAMRLLGLDTPAEFSLERIEGDGQRGAGAQYQTGAFRIEEAVAFQLLLDVMATDPAVAAVFAGQQETIDYIAGKARLVGAERAAALGRSSSWFLFFDVFDPVTEVRSRLDRVCERLAAQF